MCIKLRLSCAVLSNILVLDSRDQQKMCHIRAVVTGLVYPAMARPLFLKVKTKFHFKKRQVINKGARIIFGLAI